MINQSVLDLGTVKPCSKSRQICPSERFRVGGFIKPDKTERVHQAESILEISSDHTNRSKSRPIIQIGTEKSTHTLL